MRVSALVIDMQVDFFAHARLARHRASLARHTNSLLGWLRENGFDAIWIKTEFSPDLNDAYLEARDSGHAPVIQGTEGARILPELDCAETDTILTKKRYSAFFGTELDALLGHRTPSHLLVAGINTHACVRTTVVDAYQRDFRIILAGDCIDSYDEEHHRISWRYMDGKMARGMTNEQIFTLTNEH